MPSKAQAIFGQAFLAWEYTETSDFRKAVLVQTLIRVDNQWYESAYPSLIVPVPWPPL
jgi:hypothetical protein